MLVWPKNHVEKARLINQVNLFVPCLAEMTQADNDVSQGPSIGQLLDNLLRLHMSRKIVHRKGH